MTGPLAPGRLDSQPSAATPAEGGGGATAGVPDAWSRAWVVVILVLVVAATVAVFLDLPAPIRPAATIAFAMLAPGMAIARLVRLESHLAEFTLGLALSVAIGGLVTGVILYLGMWSPTRALIILGGVALGALALDRDLVPRTAWRQLWRAGRGRARFLAGMEQVPDTAPGAEPASTPPLAAPSPPAPAPGTPPLPGLQSRPPATAGEALPPPPVSIIRRGPRRAPVAVPPPRSGRRRQALGENPLEASDLSRGLRTTIDEMIDGLADRKDEPPR